MNAPSEQPTRLDGKTMLITGAGDGIGRAVALECGARGATVILLGRTVHKLESVYDAITGAGGPTPAIYPLDLEGATPEDYAAMRENIEKEFGRLDGLLNNAGWLGASSPVDLFNPQLWMRVIHINLNAPFLLTQACIPLLRKAPGAHVVFTGDDKTSAYWGAYGAAKAGQHAFMQILADELEETGITVNCVIPGPTRTRFRTMAYPAEDATRLPKPEAITETFLYLLSDACNGTTGETFRLEAVKA